MSAVRLLLILLCASGCVEARFTRKGDLDRTIELSRESNNGKPSTRVEGSVAKVRYTKRSCVKIKRTYLVENYERRHWPGQSIALLGTLVAGAAMITALSADPRGHARDPAHRVGLRRHHRRPGHRPRLDPLGQRSGSRRAGEHCTQRRVRHRR
jgi:hypothetical protein